MKRLIVTILLVLLIPLQVVGEEARIITAAGDPWPPFVDPQNPQEGLSLEVIRAAFKTQGFEVKYIDVPWARAENGVKKGIYDILPDVWITESRKKELMFSTPYTSNEVKFIALKDDPFEYDEMSSLQGKVVGTIRGYSYSEAFIAATHFKKEEGTDFIKNIKKLLVKRIDLAIEDQMVARQRIAHEDQKLFEQIRFLKKPLSYQGLYIASGYSNPRHKEIIEAFNRGLEIIKTNGRFTEIMNSYFLKK